MAKGPPATGASLLSYAHLVCVRYAGSSFVTSVWRKNRALAAGVPTVISGLDQDEHTLTPGYLARNFGKEKVEVIDTTTGESQEQDFGQFLATFADASLQDPPLKVKDWPPDSDFRLKFPGLYRWFEGHLTGPDVTTMEGNLNLESGMPEGSCPPDTGPKGYLAHGAAGGLSTLLHCDMTDAINHCFNARRSDGSKGGAVWTTIHRDDMDAATAWLRREKRGQFAGHPIHAQTISLTDDDVERLRHDRIRVARFEQLEGETVVIPVGVPHQVANNSPCIKIAKDYVTPFNTESSVKIGRELREHRLLTRKGAEELQSEDVLQLNCMSWWYLQRSQLRELQLARSDPDSNPWVSRISAAPYCLRAPARIAAGNAQL
ncbi:unnamed protein product [Peniophora sp. CBMAI 1063]|nr:unnamed protein product [Peniophora sp. CBMAI 1063]